MEATMPNGFDVKFMRSTPERRAAVFQIKLLFDEAHRLGEGYNLNAYAQHIAKIYTQLDAIDPDSQNESQADKDQSTKVAAIIGNKGAEAGRDWLDARLTSLEKRLIHLENQLRIGFEMEMTDVDGDNKYY
ncbi:hypothetical protein CEK71_21165 [Methylovulum psychrotolerans]|uniref:Uncharacterized protein n=2 Tax=Methylovulum psychrotolerans TaxID=1704499 RepID=A0A1Z4C492_9GAMM|nr:hypothetical protein CEK71_21165 [Methylovulum psychrotolerans]